MLTETQDMEPRQLASRALVALQCGQQYILRCLLRSPQTGHVWVVAQTELNYSIQARTGSHGRTCCSPSLAAAAAL